MKKKIHFILFLLIGITTVNAQTKEENQKIINATNVDILQEISKNSSKKYFENKAFAIKTAKEKDWKINSDKNGVLMELQGITNNGRPLYYMTHNADAAISVSTNQVYSGGGLGLTLDGTGMIAGEWDGGDVLTTHQEFNNTGSSRVIDMDGSASTHYHATHVAGTIMAGGVQANAKGMAYNANLHAYDWTNDESEMATAASNGLLISNHSYGYSAGWAWDGSSWTWEGNTSISNEEDYQFGFYSSYCVEVDNIALNAPYYLIVKSAGNDLGDWDGSSTLHPQDGGADGYDCISYKGNAKNILTVGAVNDVSGGYSQPSDVTLASFSSTGPCDDSRIKPDIVGNGVNLYSTFDGNNTDYSSISGTSMSSPNVTGSLLLLQEHYNESQGSFMKASTIKALAIHTADECGNDVGPDYKFGWGLLNTATAATVISDKDISSFIKEESYSGSTYTLDVIATGTEALTATIVWTDPAGTPPAASLDPTDIMLVNDLDMTITGTGGPYYPYKLTASTPSAAATTGDNDVDNVEKIYIANPTAGTYTITINHEGSISGGTQDFSIIVTGITVSNDNPTVTTTTPSSVTTNSALSGGNVIDEGASSVTERGIVWGTNSNPTVSDNKIQDGNVGTGSYISTITGLSASSTYYVRAYAINSNGTSYGSNIAFTTSCGLVNSFPWTEDFEGSFLPDCWSKYTPGSGNDIIQSDISNHTSGGIYSARFSSFDSSDDYNQYLFSSQIHIPENAQLSFWHGKTNDVAEVLEWGVSTTTDPNDFTWNPVTLVQSTWTESIIDLSAYAGQDLYIGFHYYGNYLYYVYLDDVEITGTALPILPIASVSSSPGCGTGSVTVSSNQSGTQTFYLRDNGGAAISDWTGDATSYEFTGLANGDYRGQVDNGGNMSTLSAATTLANVVNPSAPSSVDATLTTACAGSNNQLTYSGGSGGTFEWYSGSCGGTHIGTDPLIGFVTPDVTTTYYGRWENICGVSTCESVTINVNPLPVAPTDLSASTTEDCEGMPLSLDATGGSGDNLNWYIGSCGGTAVSGGTPFLTVILQGSTTYYARWENTCGNSICESITIVGIVEPAQPSTISGKAAPCEDASETYSVTNVSGVTYDWNLPAGWTGSSTTNSIVVTVGNSGGTITVTPSNSCGTGTVRTFDVSIGNQTAISTQPVDINAVVGEDISFNVVAVGDNLAYQWRKNGIDIGSNSNLYEINDVQFVHAGNYDVTVSGNCGDETSNIAVLSVGPNSIGNLSELGIDIYPNPSNGIFYIALKKPLSGTIINISDMTGKVIYTEIFDSSLKHEIRLKSIAKGIYFIQFKLEGKSLVSKLIIE